MKKLNKREKVWRSKLKAEEKKIAGDAALDYLARILVEGFLQIECTKNNHASRSCPVCNSNIIN